MNSTQNNKLEQVKPSTLIIGIDIGSDIHYARAFDWRGYEYSKEAFKFENSIYGFTALLTWINEIRGNTGKDEVLAGMEPTGHYWFGIGMFLKDKGVRCVLVNPFHVKRSKEFDDNNQTKSDRKDPKVIAGLVKDGRFTEPYMPEGIYAELRTASNLRFRLETELISTKNRLARWFSIYFPEYSKVYEKKDAVSGMMILKVAPLPEDIIELGVQGINQIWRDAKLRAIGIKRAESLVKAAKRSIGIKEGKEAARFEFHVLEEDYERKREQLNDVMDLIDRLLEKIPEAKKLLEIKGVGKRTVSGFLAEVGNLRRFDNPKQLQKYAGLALVSCSSGKHIGQTTISKRGRKRLRYYLFEASLALVSRNPEFKEIHKYYTTRTNNPLKKIQSITLIGCKLMRLFYTLFTKDISYNAEKMFTDIHRPVERQLAA